MIYNPVEGKYIFTKNEMQIYADVLDEFKTRHAALADKIEQTYIIGNRMMDYLEKQIVIDYHLRGEQEELERDYPQLAEKAKKYLGFELYYELSNECGKPLSPDHRAFKRLMELAEEQNQKINEALDLHH